MVKPPNLRNRNRSGNASAQPAAGKFEAPKRVYFERIGDKELALEEQKLDVEKEVELWDQNPRILPHVGNGLAASEDQIASKLRKEGGYDVLKSSIERHGQMMPIYVWKNATMKRYISIEGNTRVTVLRELKAKHKGSADEASFAFVSAKILPETLTEEDILLLLVGIHVRGSGVRDWTRYTQAKTVYDAVTQVAGRKPITTMAKLAAHMGKSPSWVSRLVGAYEFAKAYVDYHDDEADAAGSAEAPAEAVKSFSILEEISKAANFGPKVRDFSNSAYDQLRADVFDMVRAGVFTEYRDARYMQAFHEDADKWSQLKTLERGIAKTLAIQITSGTSNLGTRIIGLPDAIRKTLSARPESLTEDHLEKLHEAVTALSAFLTNSDTFTLQLTSFKSSLKKVSLEELERVPAADFDNLVASIQRARGFVNGVSPSPPNA